LKVALVKGSLSGEGAYNKSFGITLPPLGLASLAGALRSSGKHEVFIIDASAKGLDADATAKMLEDLDADVVGVTMNASPYHKFGNKLAEAIKRRMRGTVLVAGGHHATFLYPQILREGFDFAVLGEGEETFTELINALECDGEVQDVKGIAYLEDGKIVRTEPRGYLKNLDDLPIPAFDLLEKELYRADILEPGSYVITAETSRGCPFKCEFCSVTAMWGHIWRFKSAERILTELEVIRNLGYRWVFIVDDNFIVHANLADRERLFREILHRRLNLRFIAQMRADIIVKNPSIVKLASEAGLRLVFVGIESGSNDVLRKMKKGISTDISSKAVKILHQNGVLTHGGFIIGAPYENRKQIDETIRYAENLINEGLDSAQFSIYTPLPGSRSFYEALIEDKLITHNWELYNCLNPVLKTKLNPIWLFLKASMANYLFYLKKWIRTKLEGRVENPAVNIEEYKALVNNASTFLAKKLLKHIRGFIMQPIKALKLWFQLKRAERLREELISEILQAIQNFAAKENWNTNFSRFKG